MENKNAVMLSKLDGFKEIAECLENSYQYNFFGSMWNTTNGQYTASEKIPPVVFFSKIDQVNKFFKKLEEEITDKHLEFCGLIGFRYSTVAINTEDRDLMFFDRNGKQLSNFDSDSNKYTDFAWIYLLGATRFVVRCNEHTDFDMMKCFEFDKREFNINLQRFVSECRELVYPKPKNTPVVQDNSYSVFKRTQRSDIQNILETLQKSS